MSRRRRSDPKRIRPMKRRHFVEAKAYIHRAVHSQDPEVANAYARDMIREVERLTALVEQPVPVPESETVLGVASVGETAECNGKCHVGEYPDFDRDCPVHGVEVEQCPEGCGLVEVADTSIEASGYEERERSYHVIFLACGHDISWPVGTARVVDIDTGGLI